jgi:hypothetical protein
MRIVYDNLPSFSGPWRNLYSLLELQNWVLFFIYGKYRSVSERISGLKLVRNMQTLKDPNVKRQVDYSYTNRLLAIQLILKTSKTVLPFLQIEKILNFMFSELTFNM